MNDGSEFIVHERITTMGRRLRDAEEKGEKHVIVRGETGRVIINTQLYARIEELTN